MSYDFPTGPTPGQEYTPAGGPTYIWQPPRWVVKGNGVPEAPLDGQLYGRMSAAWSIVPAPTWGTLAGKPATFPPTLPIAESDVTNLTTDLTARVLKAGDTMTGNLTISRPSSSPTITLNKASAGAVNQIFASTIGVARWNLLLGGGIGENFQIQNYNDAGAQIGLPLSIDRLTSVATFSAAVNAGGAVTVPNNFTATGTAILSGTNGVYLRPNGAASGTGAVVVDTAGEVTVAHDPTVSLGVATKQYVDNKPVPDVTKAYVDSADALKVAKAGDTMSGNLTMQGMIKVTNANTIDSAADTDAPIQIGLSTARNLNLDYNNIQALNNGVGGTLSVNYYGGRVQIGSSSSVDYLDLKIDTKITRAGGIPTVIFDYGATYSANLSVDSSAAHRYQHFFNDTSYILKRYNNAGTAFNSMTLDRTSGLITVEADPTAALGVATKQYVDNKPVPDVTKAYVDSADALKVAKAGDTMTGNLTIANPAAAHNVLRLDKSASGFANQIFGSKAGLDRWRMNFGDATAESSNAGSDFSVSRYNDAGVLIDAPLIISRFSGLATVVADPTAALGVATKQYVDAKPSGATVSDTAPGSPTQGMLWFDSTTASLLIYYGTAWVQIGGTSG